MNRPGQDDDEGPVPGLAGYRLDRAPERDLWPGIAARLPPRRARLPRLVGLAAAATVVAGVAVHLVMNLAPHGAETATANAPTTIASAGRPLREHDGNRALVQANRKLTDDAEDAVLQALRSAPQSASLQRLLHATRERKRNLDQLLSRPV